MQHDAAFRHVLLYMALHCRDLERIMTCYSPPSQLWSKRTLTYLGWWWQMSLMVLLSGVGITSCLCSQQLNTFFKERNEFSKWLSTLTLISSLWCRDTWIRAVSGVKQEILFLHCRNRKLLQSACVCRLNGSRAIWGFQTREVLIVDPRGNFPLNYWGCLQTLVTSPLNCPFTKTVLLLMQPIRCVSILKCMRLKKIIIYYLQFFYYLQFSYVAPTTYIAKYYSNSCKVTFLKWTFYRLCHNDIVVHWFNPSFGW